MVQVRPGPPLNLIKKNSAVRKVIAANLSAMWLLSACQTIPEETPQPTTIAKPPQSTAIIEPQAIEPPANEASLETKIEIASAASVTPAVAAQHGDPMDFICASPIAPTGKLKERPNTQIMWEYFIDLEPVDVFVFIGGKVSRNRKAPDNNGTWTNACAVRLSYMLNNAGHTIGYDGSKTVSGEGKTSWHYYRVRDLSAHLTKVFGEADITIANGNGLKIPTTPGLVCMQDSADPTATNDGSTGHCTLWNGADTVDKSTIGGFIVKFWDLPCYVPADREGELGKLSAINEADLTPALQ